MTRRLPSTSFALFALAIGTFGIGTTEFGPMGMLPTLAQGVGIDIPTAGLLISAYAVGVAIGAPIMTVLLSRWPRRKALLALMTLFTVGNLLSAVAPNYATLLVARVITSLNHGAFMGLGSLVAASLVAKDRQASAVAAMFMGLTVANIGGVPAATWLAEMLGWRESFLAIGALGLVAMASLQLSLPPGEVERAPRIRAEVAVLTKPVILMALATTVLSASGMFTLYTYINPLLRSLAGAGSAFVTAMLVLVGVGFTIGNGLGGKLADRSVDGTLAGFLILSAVDLLAFPWLAATQTGAALAVLLWAIAAFGVVPPLQLRVMRSAAGAPALASSINIGAFNVGNAIGALVGGAALRLGLGYGAIPLAASALAACALIVVLLPKAGLTLRGERV